MTFSTFSTIFQDGGHTFCHAIKILVNSISSVLYNLSNTHGVCMTIHTLNSKFVVILGKW